MYVACSFKKWRVSWQICIASLQESATWVYSRFHRWCNILEKVVVLLQQSVPPIYATCFSKSKAILKKTCFRECNITLKWSFNMCKNRCEDSSPASVNSADHCFEKCMCLSKRIRQYIQWTYENYVFILQDSVTLPYLSGLIWINLDSSKTLPKKKNSVFPTTLVSGLVAKSLVFFCVFFKCVFVSLSKQTKGRQMPIV